MKHSILLLTLGFLTGISNAQVKTGHTAQEISLPDANNKIISLSSLKGKVVLIDFWASWCSPCRVANIKVEKLYEKYRHAGFEVYAVSIDSKKNAWIKAVTEDKVTYMQVNDNKGWDANATALYNVNAIPSTFLLDKSGTIVAIDLTEKKLERKIKELLK